MGLSFGIGGGGGGGDGEMGAVDEAAEARGRSTMPDRFKHLAKEASGEPFKWPWFIGTHFALSCFVLLLGDFGETMIF